MGEVFHYLFLEYLLSRKVTIVMKNLIAAMGKPITAITKVIISKYKGWQPPIKRTVLINIIAYSERLFYNII